MSAVSSIDVEPILTLDRFERVAEEWDGVVGLSASPVHSRHFWLRRWWMNYGTTGSARFHIARDADGTLAIAPWTRNAKRIGPLRLSGMEMAGGRVFSRAQMVVGRRERDAVRAMLGDLDRLRPWYVDPGKIPATVAVGRALRVGCKRSAPIPRRTYLLPRIDVAGGWERYLSSRSARFKKSLRGRRAARFEQRSYPADFSDVSDLIDVIGTVSRAGWAHRDRTGVASDPAEWAFWQGILHDAAANGTLRSICLFDGARPASFLLGMVHQRVLYAAKTAYDVSFAKSGAGQACLGAMVRAAADAPEIDCVDLDCVTARGDYKLGWATQVEELQTCYVFGSGPMARALARAYELRTRGRNVSAPHPVLREAQE